MSRLGPTCSVCGCGTPQLDAWFNSLDWPGARCHSCVEKIDGGKLIPAKLATVIQLRRARLTRRPADE